MKKLVIFDFDGTIADTSPGIFGSIRYAQEKMRLSEITDEQMLSYIGPPIEESYAKNFRLSGAQLQKAIKYHKEYAMMQGYRESKVYDGIPELLSDLRQKGIRTAVATLKAQETAEKILQEFKLNHLFDLVIGTDAKNPIRKSDMFRVCMDRLLCDRADTVLIGDSRYDAEGATEAGIDFIAVTYGFGFKTEREASQYIYCCNQVRTIKKILDNLGNDKSDH